MLSEGDRLAIWHSMNGGIVVNSLSLYFKRTPQHIRSVYKCIKPFPEPSCEMYFRLGVHAEQVARFLRLPAAYNQKNTQTQSLPIDEMPGMRFTMAENDNLVKVWFTKLFFFSLSFEHFFNSF